MHIVVQNGLEIVFLLGMNYTALMKFKKCFFLFFFCIFFFFCMVYRSSFSKHGTIFTYLQQKNYFITFYIIYQ